MLSLMLMLLCACSLGSILEVNWTSAWLASMVLSSLVVLDGEAVC